MTPFFWSGFLGWCVAQCIKMTRGAIRGHAIDFTYLTSTGGMPSAHSALVVAVFISMGLELGFGSPITVVAGVVSTITMFDAATVRRAAGQQALLLNKITKMIAKERKFSFQPLKEMLGHTRIEVCGGMVTGTIVATGVVWAFRTFHLFGWGIPALS
ncbi:MAG: divergent PAP2 family protein [Kiritimatiellia bacterium]